jgi:hypothetical protein
MAGEMFPGHGAVEHSDVFVTISTVGGQEKKNGVQSIE